MEKPKGTIKLLFLIPSLVGGGAEKALVNLLTRLKPEDFDIHLAVVCYIGVHIDNIPKHVKVIPIFKNDLLVRVLSFLQKKINFDLVFQWVIKRKISEEYDKAICYLDSNFTDLLFHIKARKRITWVHSSYKSYSNFSRFYQDKKYKERLINKRYKMLDHIVFVSEDCKNEFIQVFGEYPKMSILYNVINRRKIIEQSKEFEITNNGIFTFVAVGSLYPVKGFDQIIKAAALLKEKDLQFKVIILGKGFLESDLKNLVEKNSLEDNVKLLGFKRNPYPYILSGDAFIMSSLSEALPTVLIEAMILGKPCITTDCSGCKDVMSYGKYGLMVEQSVKGLADGMKNFIESKNQREKFRYMSGIRSEFFEEETLIKQHKQILID